MTLLKCRFFLVVALLVGVCAVFFTQTAQAADDVKISTYAPAEDLAGQADWYIKDLEKAVADEAEYKDSVDKIVKESNTLIVIAMALGMHDEDNKYKASAGAVIKAAKAVSETKDFDSAKKAVAALTDSVNGKTEGKLKWEKIASLPELMKQVPNINTKLKLNIKGAKFKKKAKDTAGYTAVLAVIAQSTQADHSATKDAAQVKQWEKFSTEARDIAGQLNAAIRKGDEKAATEGMKKLTQSCDDCHAVFHPETTVK
jgi:hypothetical protein